MHSQREQVIEVFSALGSIQHSTAYADFLSKLAEFKKIEDVPIPDPLAGDPAAPLSEARTQLVDFFASVWSERNSCGRYGIGQDAPVPGCHPTSKAAGAVQSSLAHHLSYVSRRKLAKRGIKFFLRIQVITYTGLNRARIVRDSEP